jgi:hypothetical protein
VGALAFQVAGLKSSLHGAVGSQTGEGQLLGGPDQAAQSTGFTPTLSTAGRRWRGHFKCG